MKMNRLTSLRKSHKMTQEKMSKAIGVSRKTYCHWEYGEREIKAVDLKKIASILCVPMEYLMGDGDDIEATPEIALSLASLTEGGGERSETEGEPIEIELELPNKSKIRLSIPADTDDDKISKLIMNITG